MAQEKNGTGKNGTAKMGRVKWQKKNGTANSTLAEKMAP